MNLAQQIRILNRLVALHNRSLATYLGYASPTWFRGEAEARAVLDSIGSQHRDIVDRLGKLILSKGGAVDYGHYPMAYTGYHDLSFEFLLGKLLENQQAIVAATAEFVEQVDDPRLKELVQETLGADKGQLESLKELQAASA